jgi:hypothetical protein
MVKLLKSMNPNSLLKHLTVFFVSLFYVLINSRLDTAPVSYQARDINFALDLLNGNHVWFGPDLTGGGKLPGPFYYYLLALPLFIYKSLTSVIFFQIVLIALSAYFFWRLLTKIATEWQATIGLTFYLFSYSIYNSLIYHWNPSFLPLFVVAILYFYFRYENHQLKNQFLAYFLIGIATQIHFSIFLVGIGFLINDIVNKRSPRLIAVSILVLLAPFIPYFIWHLMHEKQISSGEYNWLNGLNSLAYQFESSEEERRYEHFWQAGWFYFFKDLVFTGGFLSLFIFNQKFKMIPKVLWILLLITSPLVGLHFSDENVIRYTLPFFTVFILIITLISNEKILWLLIPTAALVFCYHFFFTDLTLSSFQVIHPGFFLGFLLCVALWIFLDPNQRIFKFAFLVIGFMSLALQNHMFPLHTFSYPPVSHNQMAEILNPIIERTGWDYTTFRGKTYFDQLLPEEVDTGIVYNLQLKKVSVRKNPKIDFVVISDSSPHYSEEFPKEIQLSLSNGDLVLEDQILGDEFKIQFYHHSQLKSELFWNNVGHNYINADSDIRDLADNWQFISDCENEDLKCRVYFGFKIDNEQNILKFYSYGSPIGVTSQANNASWVTYIEKMKLQINCSNFSKEFEPVQYLGHRSPGNSRFLAPFSNYVKLPCQNPKSIALKIKRGGGYKIDFKPQDLKEQTLIWNLTTQE